MLPGQYHHKYMYLQATQQVLCSVTYIESRERQQVRVPVRIILGLIITTCLMHFHDCYSELAGVKTQELMLQVEAEPSCGVS